MPGKRDGLWLLGFWLLSLMSDLIWLAWDQTPPAHDQGDHLSRALAMLQLTQQPSWAWADLWPLAPGYRGPLVYLATLLVWWRLGVGFDQAVLVNVGFHALLLAATYGLGRSLFERRVGLWAAGLVGFLPWLAFIRVDYWLDYGLMACVTLCYGCLDCWRCSRGRWVGGGWAIATGLSAGLVILAKFTGLLFIVVPALALLLGWLWRRRWWRLGQWLVAAGIAIAIVLPWLQANWLTLVGASGQSIATAPDVAVPAWAVYGVIVIDLVTPILAIAAVLGAIWGWRQGYWQRQTYAWGWWWLCLGGSYVLFSLIRNRHIRHIMPLTPLLLVGCVAALLALPLARRFTVACVVSLYVWHLWLPIPAPYLSLAPWLISAIPRAPQSQVWPHREVMATIQSLSPHADVMVGITTNTYEFNPFTLNAYGQLADFQIATRELGFRAETVAADSLALPFYLSKTGHQGPYESLLQAQDQLRTQLTQVPSLSLRQTWPLPDNSELQLYARTPAPLVVQPIASTRQPLSLTDVEVEVTNPLAVTYTWQGEAATLTQAPVLLTWENPLTGTRVFHDHEIAQQQLRLDDRSSYQITERLGLPVPEQPGTYRLTATWNGQAVSAPPVSFTIPATPLPTGSLLPDQLSQVRQLGVSVAAGDLDTVFDRVGQLSQYADERYLVAAEQTLSQRWQQEPDTLDLGYALGLVQLLQYKSEAALVTFQSLSDRDPDSAYVWGYQALIHLYNWQPQRATAALARMERLAPNDPNYHLLATAAAIMRLDIAQAITLLQTS